jgi:autotransporter passenger strand-loop-strand repeat protein
MTTTSVTSTTPTTGAIVTAGNELDVQSGGIATATSVSSGGLLMVEVGGVDSGATVSALGSETVIGSAVGDQIYGSQNVSGATAVVTNEVVQSGGTLGLNLAGTIASGTTVNAGGLLAINGRGDAINTTLNGGTLELESAKATLSGTLDFIAPSTLVISTVTAPISNGSSFGDQAVIENFTSGDVIDDKVLNGGTVSYSTNTAGDLVATLTGTSGTATVSAVLEFTGITSANFVVGSDGANGTELTYVACFCEGTRILTHSGEIAVEDLAIGDRVVTVDGAVEPIRWIGRRTYAGRGLTGRTHLLPIRIKAGALADATPKRDLLISPLHAMLIDGVLVPAHALVNGTSIVRETTDLVRYVHIELAQHDAVWAEGAASETFVDDDGRFIFQSSEGEAVSGPERVLYCAPRVEQGFALETIRRRIAERASLIAA